MSDDPIEQRQQEIDAALAAVKAALRESPVMVWTIDKLQRLGRWIG